MTSIFNNEPQGPFVATLQFFQVKDFLTARGYTRYINIRSDKQHGAWMCDNCGRRVTRSNFVKHVDSQHVSYSKP